LQRVDAGTQQKPEDFMDDEVGVVMFCDWFFKIIGLTVWDNAV